MEEYDTKAKEYAAYLVARGHDPFSVRATFESTRNLSVADARRKVTRDSCNRVVFPTTYNPRGPNVRAVIKKHSHLLSGSPAARRVFPNGVMVAYKREQNLKELLTRADPYTIKPAITDLTPRGYKRCSNKCDSCDNFVMEVDTIVSFATGKRYKISIAGPPMLFTVPFVLYAWNRGWVPRSSGNPVWRSTSHILRTNMSLVA